MMDTWDPLVVLMAKGLGYSVFIGAIFAILYTIIKYAVRDGIKLAAADLRDLAEASRRE
jgi:hypothetical protein